MNWDWDKLQQRRQNQPGYEPVRPNFDRLGDSFKRFKFNGRFFLLGTLVVLIIWLLSGFYTVDAPERGVVLRFGAYDRTSRSGLHYRLPWPFESVEKVNVSLTRSVEVGFRNLGESSGYNQDTIRAVPEESLMLTGDENIVDVQFIVQYHISFDDEDQGVRDYLFNVRDQEENIKSIAEAAMREVIGKNRIDAALTDGKAEIQAQTMELMQSILDLYGAGITVMEVKLQDVHPPNEVVDAFKDVASAREDRVRKINQAHAYANDILPRARGQAAQIVNQAEAYREQVGRLAEGEASRFLAILAEYRLAPEVTRQRLYLEAMEKVLSNPNLGKILLPGEGLSDVLPLLPLDSLTEPQAGGATAGAATDQGGAQ